MGVTNPQHRQSWLEQHFKWFLYIMTRQNNISNCIKKAWFCTTPRSSQYILETPKSPGQQNQWPFCTVHISPPKKEGLRFCTGGIWGHQKMISNQKIAVNDCAFFSATCDPVLRCLETSWSTPCRSLICDLKVCKPQIVHHSKARFGHKKKSWAKLHEVIKKP